MIQWEIFLMLRKASWRRIGELCAGATRHRRRDWGSVWKVKRRKAQWEISERRKRCSFNRHERSHFSTALRADSAKQCRDCVCLRNQPVALSIGTSLWNAAENNLNQSDQLQIYISGGIIGIAELVRDTKRLPLDFIHSALSNNVVICSLRCSLAGKECGDWCLFWLRSGVVWCCWGAPPFRRMLVGNAWRQRGRDLSKGTRTVVRSLL